MSKVASTEIKVFRSSEVQWVEDPPGPEETDPAGTEFVPFESGDAKFGCGLWQRDVQRRHFERPYHEVAYILEGEVEITTGDGKILRAGPGDILVTPQGSKGYWKSLSRVKKFWTTYQEFEN